MQKEQACGLTRMPLKPLLQTSDVVIPLLPLTNQTYHLFNEKTLAEMKPGSYLVNVCRGSVVDEAAVAQALKNGRLAGYAADVFEMEDWIRPDRPHSISPFLLEESDRTFFTPHLGSAVDTVRLEIERYCAVSILQALSGALPDGRINDIHHPCPWAD